MATRARAPIMAGMSMARMGAPTIVPCVLVPAMPVSAGAVPMLVHEPRIRRLVFAGHHFESTRRSPGARSKLPWPSRHGHPGMAIPEGPERGVDPFNPSISSIARRRRSLHADLYFVSA